MRESDQEPVGLTGMPTTNDAPHVSAASISPRHLLLRPRQRGVAAEYGPHGTPELRLEVGVLQGFLHGLDLGLGQPGLHVDADVKFIELDLLGYVSSSRRVIAGDCRPTG